MKLFLALTAILLCFSAQAGLKVATYNLGLAHTYVPLAKERLPHLAKAIASADVDVFCLQEVWEKKDRKKIAQALKKTHSHQHMTPIRQVRASGWPPTCRPWDLFGKGKVVSCMYKECGDLEGDDHTDCVIKKCGSALENLKQKNRDCAAALMAQVGKHPAIGLINVLNPFRNAGLFTYKGSDGLMLLSKYPLSEQRFFDLSSISALTKRGALVADVDVEGKKHRVLCTHLSANLEGDVPYTGTFAGWGEENKAQFASLLEEASTTGLPTVLMGDFNCGLGDPARSLDPEFEDSCRLIFATSFVDALAENNPECTFCSSAVNNLNQGHSRDKNRLIDHIYVKGAHPVSSQVFFKEKVTVKTKKGEVLTNLSDHFGVWVELD